MACSKPKNGRRLLYSPLKDKGELWNLTDNIWTTFLHKDTILPAQGVFIARMQQFSKNLRATLKFWSRKCLHAASYVLHIRTNHSGTGTRHLCLPNLCVSYDWQNKQLLFLQSHLPIGLCNGETVFFCVVKTEFVFPISLRTKPYTLFKDPGRTAQ